MRSKTNPSISFPPTKPNATAKRPRVQISDTSSEDDTPIAANLHQRNVKQALVIDTVNTGGCAPTSPRASVKLTMKSKETQEKMRSFVVYMDELAADKEHYETTVAEQKSTIDRLHHALREFQAKSDALVNVVKDLEDKNSKLTTEARVHLIRLGELEGMANEVKQQNERLVADNAIKTARAAEAERHAAEAGILRVRVDTADRMLDTLKDFYYDPVSLEYATCPILLSNGKVFSFSNIIDFWLYSDVFNGKIDGMFTCPLTRELIQVADINAVEAIAKIGESVGLNMIMPFSFEYGPPLDSSTSQTVWITYDIQSQLHLFSALVGLYRDRQYGPSTRIVQVNENHTVHMRMGAAVSDIDTDTHLYKVEFSLAVVNHIGPRVHNFRYKISSRATSKLSEFEIPKVQ